MDRPSRDERLAAVAAQRLGWVQCAVEHVHHRHNTSAILRTCDALGIHQVHLIGEHAFRPAQGPSMGAWRWLDLKPHERTEQALAALDAQGVDLWVADLDPHAHAPADLPLDRPVCLWFGAEVLGVSAEARRAAKGVVTIPMHGFAQSLNVSVAAALALHVVAERARTSHGERALLSTPQRTRLLTEWLEREQKARSTTSARVRALELLGARTTSADAESA